MATKEIKTRIALRTGDYAYWTTGAGKDIELYKGEVCICTVAQADNQATNAPTVLFKVANANGQKFADLNWVSGLAADVYTWAKKANPDWTDFPALPLTVVDNGTGKFVTDFTYSNNTLTITRSDVALDDISDKAKIALSADLGAVANLTTTAKTAVGAINEHDAEIGDLAGLNTTNKGNLVAAINEALQAVEVGGTGSVVTVTKATTPTTGSEVTYTVNQGGKPVEVKIEIPKYATSADYGVLGVAKGDDTITIGGTAQNPTIAVTANKFDAYGAAAQALADAKDYADKKPHENTAHTHSVGDGLKKTGDGGIAGDVKYELNLKFGELKDNKLQLLDATNNAVIAEFDAAAFAEDSYLDEVTYKDENGDNILEFTFTLNDGSTKTVDVDLSHLVDVYTGEGNDYITVSVENYKISAVLNKVDTNIIEDKAVTYDKLNDDLQASIDHGKEAYEWGNHSDEGYIRNGEQGHVTYLDVSGEEYDTRISLNAAYPFEGNGNPTPTIEFKKGEYPNEEYKTRLQIDPEVTENVYAILPAKSGVLALTSEVTEALNQAKKDAGDKAAVVLGEAQKYSDEKVAALAGEGNTTTVAALAGRVNTLETAEHLTEVEADTGLKVIAGTNGANNKVAIDETVVFILDCNW